MNVTHPSLSRLLWLPAIGLAVVWLIPVSRAWQLAPDLGHAWVVPLLIAYLWWERWAERPTGWAGPETSLRVSPETTPQRLLILAGLTLAALLELPLRLLLTPFPLWPALLGAFTLLCVAIALVFSLLITGPIGLRWMAGPLILLPSAMPVPSAIENSIVLPLRIGMAALAAEISNLLGFPALAMGTSIRLGGGWVGIDEACGGIRSLQACLMIGLFFGEWFRFNWGRRLWLLLAAVGAALMGNFARVLLLSLLANVGPGIIEKAHDPAGWLAMSSSLVLTGFLACRWAGYRWPERRSTSIPSPTALNASSPRFLTFSATALIAAFAGVEIGTRWWFRHDSSDRPSAQRWTAQLPVNLPTFRPQPLGKTAQEMLGPDRFIAGQWKFHGDQYVASYYIEWTHGQIARSVPFLHNPTVCLPLSGCEMIAQLEPILINKFGAEIPFHSYKFRRSGQEMLVAFTIWDPSRGRPLEKANVASSWLELLSQKWSEVIEAREHQPAQLLTISVPWSDEAEEVCRKSLESIIIPFEAL